MVYSGLQAVEELKKLGLNGTLVSMHTIKPLDKELVISIAGRMPVFTLEEHSIIGGLGSAVAECLMDAGVKPAVFRRFAIPDNFQKTVGTHDFLRKVTHLDVPTLVAEISASLKRA